MPNTLPIKSSQNPEAEGPCEAGSGHTGDLESTQCPRTSGQVQPGPDYHVEHWANSCLGKMHATRVLPEKEGNPSLHWEHRLQQMIPETCLAICSSHDYFTSTWYLEGGELPATGRIQQKLNVKSWCPPLTHDESWPLRSLPTLRLQEC